METVPARILIIDDEVFIRKSVREILLDQGYFVKEAGNSEQGFELLNKESFDLVLLDIQMPGMDGMDTLKKNVQGELRNRGYYDIRTRQY